MQYYFLPSRLRQENSPLYDRLFLKKLGKVVVHMMTSMQTYVRQGRHTLRRFALDPRARALMRGGGCFLAGLCLSAASLAHTPQPFVLGLVCAAAAVPAALIALGGCVGYLLFWGNAGTQGVVWTAAGLLCALCLGKKRIARDTPLLLPSLAGLIVSAAGVVFQQWFADETAIPIYLLRVALGAGSALLFAQASQGKDAVARWLCWGIAVLALAQIAPVSWLSLGYIAAGALAAAGAFPAAALGGLALDLAQVTQVPMTAVVCLAYFVRLLPRKTRSLCVAAPGIVYLLVMSLCGAWDLRPLPGLLLGGLVGLVYPSRQQLQHRRGETGVAQVRLEMAAGVLTQTQQLLLETTAPPVDEQAIISRCAERACGSCPCRKGCKDRDAAASLPAQLLHRPLLDSGDLPFVCRKSGRLLGELHRCQEQLRAIRADRERQKEYRAAVVQQYQFLSAYLQDLSDTLSQRIREQTAQFKAQIAVCANRKEGDNGDRCLWFAGPQCRYYALLCDGMGTGLGAVDAGKSAAGLLRQMLSAGFPAEYALRSVNSICALRGRAGIVTMDLAEMDLDSGRTVLYKWGAAPSYLVGKNGAEKIGTAVPPPGLSVTEGRETVERLSLRRGETLVMVSDGVGGEDALRTLLEAPELPPGELAAYVLERGAGEQGDDATVMAIRLVPADLSA